MGAKQPDFQDHENNNFIGGLWGGANFFELSKGEVTIFCYWFKWGPEFFLNSKSVENIRSIDIQSTAISIEGPLNNLQGDHSGHKLTFYINKFAQKFWLSIICSMQLSS